MNEIPIKEEMIPDFLAELDARSQATTETYRRALYSFFRYAKIHLLTRFTRQDIRDYRAHLKSTISNTTKSHLSPLTIQVYMNSLRQFFKYLEKKKIHPDVARNVRSERIDYGHEEKYFLTAEEVAKILASIDTQTEKGKRNRAMIHLSVTTGLLGIELSRARVQDIKTHSENKNKKTLQVQGKGLSDKNNFVIIPEEAYISLQDYLACRVGISGESALFARLYGEEPRESVKPREIRNCIKSCMNKNVIGEEKAEKHSVRSLRDTAGLLALRGEESINDVSRFMRHSRVESTLVYARHAENLINTCSQTISDAIESAMFEPK